VREVAWSSFRARGENQARAQTGIEVKPGVTTPPVHVQGGFFFFCACGFGALPCCGVFFYVTLPTSVRVPCIAPSDRGRGLRLCCDGLHGGRWKRQCS